MGLVGVPASRLCQKCKIGRIMSFSVEGGQVVFGPYPRKAQFRCTINSDPKQGCGHSYYGDEEFVGVIWPDPPTPDPPKTEYTQGHIF